MSLQPPVGRWRQLAAQLRSAIEQGQYPPGSAIPTEAELVERYQLSRHMIRQAIALLRAEGLLEAIPGRGTFVRHPAAVTVTLSRYKGVLTPDSPLGPWGAACEAAGMSGTVEMVEVARERADRDLADWLRISEGAEVIHRVRRMLTDGQVAQIQDSWLPADLVEGGPLAGPEKVPGGTYAGLIAAGHPPVTVDERVVSRMPTSVEADVLGLGPGVPVLVITRTTYDAAQRVLEGLRVVAAADRTELLYDGLPLPTG